MTVKQLIKELKFIEEKYGDIDCVLSIDTDDAFNETNLDDVFLNKYEAMDTSDGYVYSVCLKGELIPQED
jgi:hypothetical protein